MRTLSKLALLMLHQPDPRQFMPSAEAAERRVVRVRRVYIAMYCSVLSKGVECDKVG